MIKVISVLGLLILGSLASADQFQTVKVDESTPRSTFIVSYPQFFANSVPGYATINATIEKELRENACGEPQKDEPDFYYETDAKVVALNQRYVGVQINANDYCGGAHPNYSVYFLTFDSNSGATLDISREFGILPWDSPGPDEKKVDKIRAKLAVLLTDAMPKDAEENCFTKMSRKEKIAQVLDFYPVVQGLAKNKTVVVGISPPHVATVCRFGVRLPYAKVRSLIEPNSFLHAWLR